MSEQKNIYAAFVKAQQGFAPALKSSINPHFKSRYADLAACVEAVIDSLNANGIGLVQKSHPDDTGVTIETLFVHTSGESMSGGTLHVPASKHDAQGYGSALSYARRYSLMAACGIAPEDDDGNAATKSPPKKTISATDGAMEALPAAERKKAEKLAIHISSSFAGGNDWSGYEAWEAETDNEVKIATWSLLDSKVRSTIKKMKSEETATQPA